MAASVASGEALPTTPATPVYRPSLDGLRAIAIALVLLFHLDHLAGGILGVDVFFVVSGWLITFKLLHDVDHHDSVRLGRFWAGRFRRLMPASLTVLAVVAVVWPLLDISVASLRRDILWSLAWATNWGTITGGGDYWARFGNPSPLGHYWSLAIEEQFYVVWPLVLALASRMRAGSRLLVGAVAAVGSLVSIVLMNVWFDPSSPTDTYMNTAARAHSLLIGGLAATITTAGADGSLRGARIARRLAPIAALGAALIVVRAEEDSQWLFRWGFPTFAVAMVVVVVAAADGAWAPVLGCSPMRWLSERSYGLYLWHWPVFLLLTTERTHLDGVWLDVLKVAVAVAAADLSLRLLENPIRQRRTLAGRSAVVGLAAAVAVVAALAVVVVPSGSAESSSVVTLPPPATTVVPATSDSQPGTVTSDSSGTPPTTTEVVVPTGPVRVLTAGDSTAMQLADQLITYAADHPEEVVAGSAAFPGCGLSAADDGRMHLFTNEQGETEELSLAGCVEEWRSIPARVQSEQIHLVLVDIAAWDAVDIRLATGEMVSVADPTGRALIAKAYEEFVASVEAAGASVVWIRPPDADLRWDAIDSPLDDPARWTALRSIIDSLGVEEIDLDGWLQETGQDGPNGRPDGVHLADEVGTRFVREVVVPRLLEIRAGLTR